MYKDFILRFGLPETNHHDQGCIFENKLFYNLDKLIGGCFLEQHCTMRKRNNKWKDSDRAPDSKWCDHLNKVLHAYNRANNDATGYAPFFLLFGKAPRHRVDLMFTLRPPNVFSSYPSYVTK